MAEATASGTGPKLRQPDPRSASSFSWPTVADARSADEAVHEDCVKGHEEFFLVAMTGQMDSPGLVVGRFKCPTGPAVAGDDAVAASSRTSMGK
ncbi:hypothetical protein [Pleomorphomonas koreensis]|uniref:hypothetical protein n=1 Tax=Pleomorphomonas koreensis TaxID=257440 RepID=UPI0012EC3783|nr:hypothetical protein [Pleomorphomonas koreensis]